MSPPRVLTIAGSDSGAGAGVQADLKTVAALGGYALTVVTAVTAQNTLGVQRVEAVSPEMVRAQLRAVVDDIGVDSLKSGMLFSSAIIEAVVATFGEIWTLDDHPPFVLDPVCVSTSGHTLLQPDAIAVLRGALIPWATILTPNIPEAEVLAGLAPGSIKTLDDRRRCAIQLGELGCRWVYLKGGHRPEMRDGKQRAIDLLWDSELKVEVLHEKIFLDTKNTHGTGCTLSAAMATELAKGRTVPQAVAAAADYVYDAIAHSYALGSGSGPVNHLYNVVARTLPLPLPIAPDPLTSYLISYNPDAWHRYVFHPFPIGLANGTLPLASFLYFLKQDYHFLLHYARTSALSAYKSSTMEDIASSMVIVAAVVHETENHIAYCTQQGITKAALLSTPESITNIAYNRFVLDTAASGDLLDLRVATAPCLIGYGHVGKRLYAATEGVDRSSANPYWSWIAEYGTAGFQGAVETGIKQLETTVAASPISPARLESLAKIFVQTTKLEIQFWDDAMNAL